MLTSKRRWPYNLHQRIDDAMRHPGMRCLLAALCLAATAGQNNTPTRVFAVASVKRNLTTDNAIGNKFGPDSMRWTNTPLLALIEEVYRLRDYQVVGAPSWVAKKD
jgi:hypothetical protein